VGGGSGRREGAGSAGAPVGVSPGAGGSPGPGRGADASSPVPGGAGSARAARAGASAPPAALVRPGALALGLGLGLVLLFLLSLRIGSSGLYGWDEALRGLAAALGLGDELPGSRQTILGLRLCRTLVSIGVGAALALSGGLLQGVFRNALASPAIIGVSSGASLGAAFVILALGGYGPLFLLEKASGWTPVLIMLGAFGSAMVVAFTVTTLATTSGRLSVPTLLLVGIAINAIAAGVLAAIQSLVLRDFEIARALMTWTFGTLDDRAPSHVLLLAGALLTAIVSLRWVAYELDLFVAGEEDARGLGVDTQRVKWTALVAAALAAAAAVAVAGQIAFVGLVVPHLLRMVCGPSHRRLLPLCLLGGPVLLLGAEVVQRVLLGDAYLQPGVVMSLLGGPFFLFLLMRQRAALTSW